MNILISVSNELMRKGISSVIDEELVIEKSFEFIMYNEVRSVLERENIGIAILDTHVLRSWGLTVIDDLRVMNPSMKILVFSKDDEALEMTYLRRGIHGFCSFNMMSAEFKIALSIIMNGGVYVTKEVKAKIVNTFIAELAKPEDVKHSLTKRETEIYSYLLKGYTTTDISRIFGLKMSTVSTFKSNIFKKIKVRNVTELILKSGMHGEIPYENRT